MIAARGVDHRIGFLRLLGQHRGVIKGADHCGDAQASHLSGLFGAAYQAGDVVPGVGQAGCNGATDKTCGAGNEYVHGECS